MKYLFMITKEDILKAILKEQKQVFGRDGRNVLNTLHYCQALHDAFQRFYNAISEKSLFDAPKGWYFEIEQDLHGVRLYLVNEQKERYILFEQKPEMLTPLEYAEVYEVTDITVRQWIRRGKLHGVE